MKFHNVETQRKRRRKPYVLSQGTLTTCISTKELETPLGPAREVMREHKIDYCSCAMTRNSSAICKNGSVIFRAAQLPLYLISPLTRR